MGWVVGGCAGYHWRHVCICVHVFVLVYVIPSRKHARTHCYRSLCTISWVHNIKCVKKVLANCHSVDIHHSCLVLRLLSFWVKCFLFLFLISEGCMELCRFLDLAAWIQTFYQFFLTWNDIVSIVLQQNTDILFLKFFKIYFVCTIIFVCMCVIREEADEEASDILTDRWRLIQLIYYPRGECHSEIGLH